MGRIIAKHFYRAEEYRADDTDVAGWVGYTREHTITRGMRAGRTELVEDMCPIAIGAVCEVIPAR